MPYRISSLVARPRASLDALPSAHAALALAALLCACAAPERARPPGRDAGPGSSDDAAAPDASLAGPCAASPREVICVGATATTCSPEGTADAERDCAAEGLACVRGLGCRTCIPGSGRCGPDGRALCSPDGDAWIPQPACNADVGETCNDATGRCDGPCADAARAHSYLGCEYWPVPTINSLLPAEHVYAVVVANPNDRATEVTVDRAGENVATRTVAAGGLEVIELPWIEALRELVGDGGRETSALIESGAYHLRTTLPVTVYQFNPLDYRIARDCADELSRAQIYGDGVCDSFTNDASLLLPAHALTGSYLVLSWPSRAVRHTGLPGGPVIRSTPGFFTVTGADVGPVDVTVKVHAFVEASADGVVRALRPDESATFRLAPGDTLQIVTAEPTECPPGAPTDTLPTGIVNEYCDLATTHDLTGTEVRATGRVQVIGGHSCAFVPSNRWACDHLEESVFPVESWGREAIVGITRPLRGEPNLIRVVSAGDGNEITFEPASVHPPITLHRGQLVQFESHEHFVVRGSAPIAVMQFLVGQDHDGPGASGPMANGDPSLSLVIPTEQLRTDYTFLAPGSYRQSFLNVTAPEGATILLDGTPIDAGSFTSIMGSGHAVAQLEIPAGTHHVESDEPFGIVVYGFGIYTSYAYPGGLDLEPIAPPI